MALMGNSKQICEKHYIRAVKIVDAARFWKLRPQSNSPKLVGELSEENLTSLVVEVISR